MPDAGFRNFKYLNRGSRQRRNCCEAAKPVNFIHFQVKTFRPAQTRANVKNNKYKDVYDIVHKAFAPVIVGMSGQIHADFLRILWVLADN